MWNLSAEHWRTKLKPSSRCCVFLLIPINLSIDERGDSGCKAEMYFWYQREAEQVNSRTCFKWHRKRVLIRFVFQCWGTGRPSRMFSCSESLVFRFFREQLVGNLPAKMFDVRKDHWSLWVKNRIEYLLTAANEMWIIVQRKTVQSIFVCIEF